MAPEVSKATASRGLVLAHLRILFWSPAVAATEASQSRSLDLLVLVVAVAIKATPRHDQLQGLRL